MYVCLCHGVTDHQIRAAVTEGHATRLRDLNRCLGVASECGACARCAHEILQDTLTNQHNTAKALPVAA